MALPQAAAHTPGQLFAERHTGMSINGPGNNTAFDSAVARGEAALSAVVTLSERIRSPAGTVAQVTQSSGSFVAQSFINADGSIAHPHASLPKHAL